MRANKKKVGIVLLSVFLIVGLLSSPLLAESKQEIIEKAKKEGKLLLYWTSGRKTTEKIIKKFNKKYPFIKVSLFQSGSFKTIARYYQEVLARRPTCDMLSTGSRPPFTKFYKEGNLLEYHSPEWNNFVDLPEGYFQRGYYAPMRLAPNAIMVNTNYIDPASIKSYDDILLDKFKGNIVAGDVEHSNVGYPFYYALRKATGSTHYWKRLGELKARVFVSSQKASEACVAGEWPVVFDIWLYRGYLYGVKKGAPIRSVVPKEGAVLAPSPCVIMKQASNPNAAKLMQDFVFSKEIQEMMVEDMGYHSPRKDVAPAKTMPALQDMKIMPIDYDDLEKKRKEWIADWKRLMNR